MLGFVQGASEFLPISSSGHLVIFQALLGIEAENIYLEVALHFGTLLAVVVYFRRDLVYLIGGTVRYLLTQNGRMYAEQFRMFLCLLVGTIPVAIGGSLLKDDLEATFESTAITGGMLLMTAVLLLLTRMVSMKEKSVNYPRALAIGVAQLVAILPGISRSGSTIATGMFLGVNPTRAARFSFLLSIPAVSAAFILKLLDLAAEPVVTTDLVNYGVGALVAFLVGLAAIHYLLKLIATNRFWLFGFWCLAAGVLTLTYF